MTSNYLLPYKRFTLNRNTMKPNCLNPYCGLENDRIIRENNLDRAFFDDLFKRIVFCADTYGYCWGAFLFILFFILGFLLCCGYFLIHSEERLIFLIIGVSSAVYGVIIGILLLVRYYQLAVKTARVLVNIENKRHNQPFTLEISFRLSVIVNMSQAIAGNHTTLMVQNINQDDTCLLGIYMPRLSYRYSTACDNSINKAMPTEVIHILKEFYEFRSICKPYWKNIVILILTVALLLFSITMLLLSLIDFPYEYIEHWAIIYIIVILGLCAIILILSALLEKECGRNVYDYVRSNYGHLGYFADPTLTGRGLLMILLYNRNISQFDENRLLLKNQ